MKGQYLRLNAHYQVGQNRNRTSYTQKTSRIEKDITYDEKHLTRQNKRTSLLTRAQVGRTERDVWLDKQSGKFCTNKKEAKLSPLTNRSNEQNGSSSNRNFSKETNETSEQAYKHFYYRKLRLQSLKLCIFLVSTTLES